MTVLDPCPPGHKRDISTHDGSLAAELRLRGVISRDHARRIGVSLEEISGDTVKAGGWLMDGDCARVKLTGLKGLVRVRALTPKEAARELRIPDPALVFALMDHSLLLEQGFIRPALARDLDSELLSARDSAFFGRGKFETPAEKPNSYLLAHPRLLRDMRVSGLILQLPGNIILRGDAATKALRIVTGLSQPFSVSEARIALRTNRRVCLALLQRLDELGGTKKLPDGRRIVIGSGQPPID
ncbi:SelB C-terminal domain-containing protein [Nocardioides sp. CBS4Y-1]|uniref:SelB C-terminal domain-containing protein n=2 Tax=Nocardioides acrostichi TaxID=2784339 RepID=A0A930YEJ0_9ACTN|nr:SelB C-terminal domain-containing protein [Nocardioides acrostichi]